MLEVGIRVISSGLLSIQHLTSHVPRPFTPGRLVTFYLSVGAAAIKNCLIKNVSRETFSG